MTIVDAYYVFVSKNCSIYFQVNRYGYLTFNSAWYQYSPLRIPMYGTRDIIAPFWTYTYYWGYGHIYYNQYTNGSVLQHATHDINEYFPGLNFNASWVLVTTWYKVPHYSNTEVSQLVPNRENMQCVYVF